MNPSPQKNIDLLGRQSSTSWIPTIELGPNYEKALQINNLPTELVKWREMVADRNQWRAVCGSKKPSTTKETLTSSRQDIWAELRAPIRHYTLISTKTYTEAPDVQTKRTEMNEKKYIQSDQPA
jgi:hypothetical protein